MRESTLSADEIRPAVEAAVREVLSTCDPDRLARRLGLRSAAAASALRANEAALCHLTTRLADGCEGLAPEDAKALTASLFEENAVSEDGHD